MLHHNSHNFMPITEDPDLVDVDISVEILEDSRTTAGEDALPKFQNSMPPHKIPSSPISQSYYVLGSMNRMMGGEDVLPFRPLDYASDSKSPKTITGPFTSDPVRRSQSSSTGLNVASEKKATGPWS